MTEITTSPGRSQAGDSENDDAQVAAKPARIVIVDDNPPIVALLRRALVRAGYDVSGYCSAEEALRSLRSDPAECDLIISDINMPDQNGLELLEEVRAFDDTIIGMIMTGDTTLDHAVQSIRKGVYDFLCKPIEMRVLYTSVARALKHRKLLLQNRRYRQNLEDMVEKRGARITSLLADTRRAYEFTLTAMVEMLDAREHDSAKHSFRVRELALVLGEQLDVSGPDLRMLGHGALLHDIGKIGIPDAILCKPGPLTAREWEIMEEHPEIGRRVLRSASWLEGAVDIIYSHHERYDGSGYPRGLHGVEICVGARIFTVVDAYDAMRSSRIYRQAIPEPEVVAEIENQSGIQFDPDVVAAFLACRTKMDEVFIGLSAGME